MCVWAVLASPVFPSCRPYLQNAAEKCKSLLSESRAAVERQDYDAATGLAAQALEAARVASLPQQECRALLALAGADIATSRDSVAWIHAEAAEKLARRGDWPDLLSRALANKAQICSYAEVSPDFNRNDEGLGYATEAFKTAEIAGHPELKATALYAISSLLTNKNRWNNPPEKTLYAEAERYLDMADSVAAAGSLSDVLRKGVRFRVRHYMQGGRYGEMVDMCYAAIEVCPENDFLTRMDLYDRLVRVLPKLGRHEEAIKCYEQQNKYTQLYFRQKADETLQEMETRYETREKERQIEKRNLQIIALLLFVLLLVAVSILAVVRVRDVRRRNRELQKVNASKEQLIEFLSNDLRNPTNSQAEAIRALSEQSSHLSPKQIHERCEQIARQAETLNEDVADYIGDIIVERSRKIADAGLTSREIEVVRLCAEGLSSSEIAAKLFVSVHTVSRHRQNIYAKLDVKNVADMIRRARELGLV